MVVSRLFVLLIPSLFRVQIPFFKVYQDYFNNYESGCETIEKLSKKKEVSNFLKQCEKVADGHQLSYLLIMPVQRIPRYSLLLKELIKYSEAAHPDYSDLRKAAKQLDDFTNTINEGVRATEASKKLAEIADDTKRYIGFKTLVARNRKLIYDSDVTVKMANKEFTWMLLFNDRLAFASTEGKSKKKALQEHFPLSEVFFVDDLSDVGGMYLCTVLHCDHSLCLFTKARKATCAL